VPYFDLSPDRWGDVDWALFQNGFVHKYWRSEVLDATVDWLMHAGYEVVSLNASLWDSEEGFHHDAAAALTFPDYYGKNLNALNDCLGDVASYQYGASKEATGTVLVVRRYESFVALDRPMAEAVVDIFAVQARVGALLGHRMLMLIQSDDPDLSLPPAGASPVGWNREEFPDTKRHPTGS
jgi:hypothetical protein